MTREIDWSTATREWVLLDELTPSQTSLRIDGLVRWHRAETLDPVRVVRREGRRWLFDGHHRLAVAYLRGDVGIWADVVDP